MSQTRISGNNNNFATPSNFICGSAKLNLTHIYCQSVNIPGINMNHPFLPTAAGSALNVTGDMMIFNPLSIQMIIDENFKTYLEFIEKLNENISSTNGTFANTDFDFFIEITNTKGKNLFRIDFYNVRLQSIGDLELNSTSEETEMLLNVELMYDYYEIEYKNKKLELRI